SFLSLPDGLTPPGTSKTNTNTTHPGEQAAPLARLEIRPLPVWFPCHQPITSRNPPHATRLRR
ncbi:hypothetical protein, partial [Thermogemmatispora sp.]|uniref:hypothetical protein n=1 Tax=Thermogemmatispora sp. TaxID=1968838 RepID=UPI00261A5CED